METATSWEECKVKTGGGGGGVLSIAFIDRIPLGDWRKLTPKTLHFKNSKVKNKNNK